MSDEIRVIVICPCGAPSPHCHCDDWPEVHVHPAQLASE